MKSTEETLAEKIVRLRKMRRFSQEKLASQSKVPRRTIQNIEYGETLSPELDTIRGLAKALGVRASELIEDEGGAPDLSAAAEMLSKFAALSPVLQKMALTIIYQDTRFVRGLQIPPEMTAELQKLLPHIAKAKA